MTGEVVCEPGWSPVGCDLLPYPVKPIRVVTYLLNEGVLNDTRCPLAPSSAVFLLSVRRGSKVGEQRDWQSLGSQRSVQRSENADYHGSRR